MYVVFVVYLYILFVLTMNGKEENENHASYNIWSNVILIKKTRELFSFSMWELRALNVSGTLVLSQMDDMFYSIFLASFYLL